MDSGPYQHRQAQMHRRPTVQIPDDTQRSLFLLRLHLAPHHHHLHSSSVLVPPAIQ